MFFCSFIDVINLTHCNCYNIFFNYRGTSFAFSKFLNTVVIIKKTEKETRKCQRSFADSQRDVLVRIDAKFLSYTALFLKGLKEDMRFKTVDRRKKGEMVGLESTNGQV